MGVARGLLIGPWTVSSFSFEGTGSGVWACVGVCVSYKKGNTVRDCKHMRALQSW